jgi:hypothetical protein
MCVEPTDQQSLPPLVLSPERDPGQLYHVESDREKQTAARICNVVELLQIAQDSVQLMNSSYLMFLASTSSQSTRVAFDAFNAIGK